VCFLKSYIACGTGMIALELVLPPCKDRGRLNEHQRYPCYSTKLINSDLRGVTWSNCKHCPYSDRPPPRLIFDKRTGKTLPVCVHLGEPTGELRDCLTCQGVRLKVFACEVYERCTLLMEAGLACCHGCPSFEAKK